MCIQFYHNLEKVMPKYNIKTFNLFKKFTKYGEYGPLELVKDEN